MSVDKLKMSAFLIQCGATMSVAYLSVLAGMIFAWPSYTIANFRSNDTVLSSPMTTLQVSLLGSVVNIGALVTAPICACIIDRLGRKYSAALFGLPFVISWGIISITTCVPLVIAAVGFAGVSVGGQVVSSVYISEICHKSIRGAMTSSIVSGYYLGLLISYILGGCLSYHQVVYTFLTLSVLYIVLLMLLKESPVFLLRIGKEQEAAKSIAFYWNVDVTSKEVEIEVAKIKLQLDPRIDQILEANDELVPSEVFIAKPPSVRSEIIPVWTYLKKSKSSRRALFAVIIVMSLTFLMGCIVLQVYAELLFQEAVPTMSSNLCSIFLAIIYLVATLISAPMLDMFGRKFLLTTSSVVSGVFCLLLGTQLQLSWAPNWFTVFCIYGYSFIYSLGAGVVPFVLGAEVFLPEIRGFGNSMNISFMWIMSFLILFIFNPLAESVGLGPLFYWFGLICFIGAIYSQYCLPETKGLSVEAIQVLFLRNKE